MSNFNENIVNKQFRIVYDYLKEIGKIKSKSDIAAQLGTYNHVINSILNGKRSITLEQMNKLIEMHGINANYLFGANVPMFSNGDGANLPKKNLDFKIIQNITLVPHKAMAGGAISPQDMEEYQKFAVPGLNGNLIAIEISGDSMLPNITNGDIVICEQVEGGLMGLNSIRDNSIYVVVTDSVVAKRVQKIKQANQVTGLRLISDNKIYPPYEVDGHEVVALYRVKHRITNYGIE